MTIDWAVAAYCFLGGVLGAVAYHGARWCWRWVEHKAARKRLEERYQAELDKSLDEKFKRFSHGIASEGSAGCNAEIKPGTTTTIKVPASRPSISATCHGTTTINIGGWRASEVASQADKPKSKPWPQ